MNVQLISKAFDIYNCRPRPIICISNENNNWSPADKNAHMLEVGKVYHVYYVIAYGWYTDVYLEEFPDVPFNSVNFEEVTKHARV